MISTTFSFKDYIKDTVYTCTRFKVLNYYPKSYSYMVHGGPNTVSVVSRIRMSPHARQLIDITWLLVFLCF